MGEINAAICVVLFSLVMRRAIEFDHELHLGTYEICDERSDGCLSAKFEAIEAAIAESLPELVFGWSDRLAEVAGASESVGPDSVSRRFRHGTFLPSPWPSPRWGEGE